MAQVTGMGGVFLHSNDPTALAAWYTRHLGITFETYDGPQGTVHFHQFFWREDGEPARRGETVYSIMSSETRLGPRQPECTVNYRIDDLDALVAQLRAAGVEVDDVQDSPEGRFARTVDPDGNKVELWQPPRG